MERDNWYCQALIAIDTVAKEEEEYQKPTSEA
jgi:hypothetical protein